MSVPLLSPDLLAKLERLDFASRLVLQGRAQGERRSLRKGRSVEFADYRQYAQGDDLRFVDWNIAARLDRLFVKLFLEEDDLRFAALIDDSPSMQFGEPTKLFVAQQLAAALGFIGLVRGHRVRIEPLGQDRRAPQVVWHGRHQAWQMFDYVAGFAGSRGPITTDNVALADGVKNFCLRHRGRGVVVLVSDLLDKAGFEEALRRLAALRCETYIVHVLSREELEPDVQGELKLVDAEDDDAVEITAGAPLRDAYDRALAKFLHDAEEFCVRRGLNYLRLDNRTPLEQVVAGALGRGRLVRT